MPSREDYNNQIKALFDEYNQTMGGYSRRVYDLLKSVQAKIASDILGMDDNDWLTMKLKDISAAIERDLAEFSKDYAVIMKGALDDSAKTGIAVVVDPIKANVKVSVTDDIFMPVIMNPYVKQYLGAIDTLIANVSRDAGKAIVNKIVIGMSTGTPRHEIIQQIIGELGGNKLGFKSLNARAWAIYRTESARMLSVATEMEIGQVSQYIPGMRKTWYHGIMTGLGQEPREGHVALDSTSVGLNEMFVDPVTGDLLAYPHDPAAPASAVINCGCVSVGDIPEDMFKETV